MGNGPSNGRRNGRIQQNPLPPSPPPRMPPPGYPGSLAPYPGPSPYPLNGQHHLPPYPLNGQHHLPYFHNGLMTPPMAPPHYQQGHMQPPTNGQYMMGLQTTGFRPVAPTHCPPSHAPPLPETQKTNTIRNDVNLSKATLRLERDEENPGFHLVAFSFDATVAGSISVFFLAKEKEQCGFTLLKPNLYKATRVPFEKGLSQQFRQAPGSGVNLAMFDERDLRKEGEDGIYALVVRAETMAKDPAGNASSQDERAIGAPLPKWIHCQTTQAAIEKKEDGNHKVRVIRQTIWVDGTRYELKEIYGIENSGGSGTFDGNDSGKECVICMSEPRDTTLLPCRHMCMCNDCAKVLRFQTNRCPICRTPVEKLLEMKFSQTNNFDLMDSQGASGSRNSAGSG